MIILKRSELVGQESIFLQVPVEEVLIEELRPESKEVTIQLIVDQANNQFRLHGKAILDVKETCDRCLTEYVRRMEGSFNIFLTGNTSLIWEKKESDVYLFPSNQPDFDISPAVRESILLEETMKHLCQEDCKGLCQNCGINLNSSTCTCDVEDSDERWAPLKNLKLTLSENKYGTS
jgi:uncharacterized protein